MSNPSTPVPFDEDTLAERTISVLQTTVQTQEIPEAQPKAKKPKAAETPTQESGKSLLPYARVQKILKADKELIMVQREAVFLISCATEEFVNRLSEAAQMVAGRDGRTTVQGKDLVSSVRRAEEFAFLEELLPWLEPEQPGRKPQESRGGGKGKEKDDGKNRSERDAGTTMLDHFISKSARDGSPDGGDDDRPQMNVVTNGDGTMSIAPS